MGLLKHVRSVARRSQKPAARTVRIPAGRDFSPLIKALVARLPIDGRNVKKRDTPSKLNQYKPSRGSLTPSAGKQLRVAEIDGKKQYHYEDPPKEAAALCRRDFGIATAIWYPLYKYEAQRLRKVKAEEVARERASQAESLV